MFGTLEPSWQPALGNECMKPYFTRLTATVGADYATEIVYPPQDQVFAAFSLTPLSTVKVVILGQDPYHGAGQAHGLAFSVPEGHTIPPSLRNIYKEIETDLGHPSQTNGNLETWARQGTLLLNSVLTVRAGAAGSHQKLGWEEFTDAVIRNVSEQKTGVVFMLWGKYAERKGACIDRKKHLVLTAAHPSPLSAHNGFFGCRHFSQANTYLTRNGHAPIRW
jgi:uracil-DNA glycosylase